ncbi:LLM class flavin-dependent oxidoreductase [Amycolatopsis sp. GM8]|uniref:LLM class flavin-dependent oxidoreductase n=1 Tax=Amycolatopsis sp. GM8 TaxID=2896530 RepID=UPI001F2DA629|nr:LLM class flavin-dependent oxidoreductase [Amycolatopsis sp. GM8]
MARTRFGVHTALENCTVADLRTTWKHAEDLGFDWVSVWDHLHPAVRPLDAGSLDSVACHAALALTTHRVRVGSLVYSVGFRHPGILARAAATIDQLSQGRLELGLGAGWHRDEYEAYGFPFEAPAVRLRRLREAIEVVRLLWDNEIVDYEGQFYQLRGARCGVWPVQEKPRIWVGASGERLGLAVVAAVNDGWNCSSVTPEEFARKRAIVMDAAADPGSIVSAVNLSFDPADGNSAGQITDEVGRYVDAGADMIVLRVVAPFPLDELEQFATHVIPCFAR